MIDLETENARLRQQLDEALAQIKSPWPQSHKERIRHLHLKSEGMRRNLIEIAALVNLPESNPKKIIAVLRRRLDPNKT